MQHSNTDLKRVAIVEGVRTPFAKMGTRLKDVPAYELGRLAATEVIARADFDPKEIDEVIFGNTGNPAEAANISRVIALQSGVPKQKPADTVHRNCASGMQSIATAFDRILSGMADVILCGGAESMSNIPLLFSKKLAETFAKISMSKSLSAKFDALAHMKPKYLKPVIGLMEGLTDPFSGLNMGQTAEVLAREFNITRHEQDAFALLSHKRAVEAQKEGRLDGEMTPVFVAPKYEDIISEDIGPRESQTLEALGKLKPIFEKENGTVTAGNACGVTDGAAALLLMSEKRAKELGRNILGYVRAYAFAGLDPERMGLGPVFATPVALQRAGLSFQDIGLVELNEAFAAQVIACERAFASEDFCRRELNLTAAIGEIDRSKLNVNGGAIALGHPVGATGSRLVLTLLREMERRRVQFGLATLCIGGGQGGAMIVEKDA